MTLLFRDTAFIGSDSLSAAPSMSVDRAGAGYAGGGGGGLGRAPRTVPPQRSVSAAPAVPRPVSSKPSKPTTRRLWAVDHSDRGRDRDPPPPPLSLPGDGRRARRASLNPGLGGLMMEQVKHLFKSLSSPGCKSGQGQGQDQGEGQGQGCAPGKTTSESFSSSMRDLLAERGGGGELEDDVHYLEASESPEGPPSQRVFARLNYRVG
jgi:hypothetical protein